MGKGEREPGRGGLGRPGLTGGGSGGDHRDSGDTNRDYLDRKREAERRRHENERKQRREADRPIHRGGSGGIDITQPPERGGPRSKPRLHRPSVREELQKRGVPTMPDEMVNWEEKGLLKFLKISERISGPKKRQMTGRGEFTSGVRKSVGDVVGGIATTAYAGEQIGKRVFTKKGRIEVSKGISGAGKNIKALTYTLPSTMGTTIKKRPFYALGYGLGTAATFILPGKGVGKVRAGKMRLKIGTRALKSSRAAEEIFSAGDLSLAVGKAAKVTKTEKIQLLVGDIKTVPKTMTEASDLSQALIRANREILPEVPHILDFGKSQRNIQTMTKYEQYGPVVKADIHVTDYETFPMSAKLTGYGKVRGGMAKPGKGGELYEFEQLEIGKYGQRRTITTPKTDEGIRGLIRSESQPGDPYKHITGILIEDIPIYKHALGPVIGKTKPFSKYKSGEMSIEPDITSLYTEPGLRIFETTSRSKIGGGIIVPDILSDVSISHKNRYETVITPDIHDISLPDDRIMPMIDGYKDDDLSGLLDLNLRNIVTGDNKKQMDITDKNLRDLGGDIIPPDIPRPKRYTKKRAIEKPIPLIFFEERRIKSKKKHKRKKQRDYYDIYTNIDVGGLL